MTKFFIEYNPYLVNIVFKKDGKVLDRKSRIGSKSNNKRLQGLLGESSNWKGLLEEIAIACDDDEVEIKFKGRKIDYDDLKYTIDFYKGNVKFVLSFEETKNDNDVISELDTVFKEIKEKGLPEFRQKNKKGKDIFEAYEEVKNGVFEVNVIATMSSGKSTLINSLLHTELLPSENQACTATIARILDNDSMEGYEAECYAEDGKTVVYERSAVNSDILRKYNSDNRVTYIDIEGSIPEISSEKIQLRLTDTPGPNNAGDEKHERLTSSIIKQTNAVVLYVMNATQLEIKDDKDILMDISNEMKKDGKESRDKYIFVINKCDAIDEEKENLKDILDDVRKYLKQFGIVEPILIPTSAKMALVIRKNRDGVNLSRVERNTLNDVKDFVNTNSLHFEDYATLTSTVKEKMRKEVIAYHADEENWDLEALIHSGVPGVEQTISEYIDKYAYPIKIKNAIKDIVDIVNKLNRDFGLDKKIANDNAKLEMLRNQIDSAQKTHENSEKIYENFKSRVSGLQIEDIDEADEQFKVEMDLQEMTKPYDGRTKVDKIEAENLIAKFQEKLDGFQKDTEKRLRREIDSKIFWKCEEMLEEYTELVTGILDDIKIEGYEFTEVSSFAKIDITDLDDIKNRNQEERFREEKRWKPNPERAGFFGFFKFWKPKEISYYVRVREGIDVNIVAIILEVLTIFSKSIKNNISSMFRQAEEQVVEYKTIFDENIDNLKDEITKILSDLKKRTEDAQEIRNRVAENEELAQWMKKIGTRIETLLKF